jgi:hypothetical protein
MSFKPPGSGVSQAPKIRKAEGRRKKSSCGEANQLIDND